jgi:hypothetical protein
MWRLKIGSTFLLQSESEYRDYNKNMNLASGYGIINS